MSKQKVLLVTGASSDVGAELIRKIGKNYGIIWAHYYRADTVIDELKDKGLLYESRGAQVVDMGEDENPAIIVKSDGTSIYLTRDLASFNT